jgi:hypothetical protein
MFLEVWTENANLYGIGSGGVPSPSLADYVRGPAATRAATAAAAC